MDTAIEIIKINDARTVARLMEIEKQAFGEASLDIWTLVPLIRHGRVLALIYGGEIAGCAQFVRDWENPAKAYLVGIAVDEKHRGRGLGTLFLAQCLETLKNVGIKSVELTVHAGNLAAVRVYEKKLGFRVIEDRKSEYGVGEDRLVMEREL